MFEFLMSSKNNALEAVAWRIRMNMENNYKDAAQLNLKEFEKMFDELDKAGKLNTKQKAYYENELASFRDRMKNFTHKDQKPYWT